MLPSLLHQTDRKRDHNRNKTSTNLTREAEKKAVMRARVGPQTILEGDESVTPRSIESDVEVSEHDSKIAMAARKHEKITHRHEHDEEKLEHRPMMVNPKDPRKTYFDLFMGLLIVLSVIEVPWRIATDVQAEGGWDVWGWFVDVMFTIDIIVNFRTAYLNEDGEIIWDLPNIRSRYLKGWFTVDLLSTIPFDKVIVPFISNDGASGNAKSAARSGKLLRILRVVRLLKLTRLLKMAKLFSNGDGNELLGQSTMDLIKMLVQVTFAGHFLACIFLMVSNFQKEDTSELWVIDSGVINNDNPWLTYMVAMYWSFTTMTTVGYGDINVNPRNIPEHVFAMIAMVIGTSIFGYFVGNITVIFESFDVQSSITKEKLESVRDYARDKDLPEGLKKRLQKHYIYFYLQKGCFDTDGMFERIDATLRDDMLLDQESNMKTMHMFPNVFCQSDRSCHVRILECLLPAFANEAEEVFVQGEHGTEIYFLRKGEVRLFCDNPNSEERFTVSVAHLQRGEVFGVESIINDVPHSTTAIAEEYTELFFLKKLVLVEIFYDYPDLLRQFHVIADTASKIVSDIKKQIGIESPLLNDEPTPNSPTEKGDFPLTNASEVSDSPRKVSDNSKVPELEMAMIQSSPISRGKKYEPSSPGSPNQSIRRSLTTIPAKEKHMQLWRAQKLIHPEMTKKIIWDLFQGVLIVYSVITVPYRLAFQEPESNTTMIVNTIIDLLFATDILLNFFCAYFDDEGKLITGRVEVITNYMKTWFFIDFFATFPIDGVVQLANPGSESNSGRSAKILRVLRLFRLFKLARLLKLGSFFNKFEDMITINPAVVKLVKLFTIMWFVAHLEGCFFFAITDYDDNSNRGWAKDYFCLNIPWHPIENRSSYSKTTDLYTCMEDVDLAKRYWASIYWALTTMTTVGYGDITPNINVFHEMFATVCVQLLGTIVFAYTLGGVMNLVVNYDPAARATKQEMQLLDGYMQQVRFTKVRQRRLRSSFYNFVEMKSIFSESEILYNAPNYIVRDVYNFLAEQSLIKIHVLRNLDASHEGFIAFLYPYLIPAIVPSKNFIFRSGVLGRGMYFIIKGSSSVEFDGGKSESTLGEKMKFESGDHFGQATMLIPPSIPFANKVSMKATSDCSLIMLKRSSLYVLRELSNLSIETFLSKISENCNIDFWIRTAPHYKESLNNFVSKIQESQPNAGGGAIHKELMRRGSEIMDDELLEKHHNFSAT